MPTWQPCPQHSCQKWLGAAVAMMPDAQFERRPKPNDAPRAIAAHNGRTNRFAFNFLTETNLCWKLESRANPAKAWLKIDMGPTSQPNIHGRPAYQSLPMPALR